MPPPLAREPLTLHSLLRDVVPAALCYYLTAVLMLVPNTFAIRLAILPLSLLACFNSATRIDLVKTFNYDGLAYLNHGLVAGLTLLSMRLLTWTFQTSPFWRVKTIREMTPQSYAARPGPSSSRPKDVFMDAFDLCCNLRGCGWNWSLYVHVPQETRLTNSSRAFAHTILTSLLFYLVMLDISQYTVEWFAPTTVGSTRGGSIFDASLPPSLRYSSSVFLTIVTDMLVYCFFQAGYHIATFFGVLVFRQDVSLWPPAFDTPWFSTSLSDFWGKRWHQWFRDVFISLGGKPMSLIFGRAGGVLGAFLVSGILHYVGLWGMGRGTDFVRVGGCFIAHGIGIILEHTWRKVTGYSVGGWYGRLWAYLWVIGWGHLLLEAWATKGLMGSTFLPRYLRITTYIVMLVN